VTARSKVLTIAILVGFVALLLWSTLASQHVECAVAVEFRGRSGTASASAASEADAVREALTAACGPMTSSMDERIACVGTPPISRRCHPV
jgi:hypothetical protein